MSAGLIVTLAGGLLGLANSANERRAADKARANANSTQSRYAALAEESYRASSDYTTKLQEYVNQLIAEGTFSPDAQVERAKSELADYESRNLAGVNARARASGFRPGDTQIEDASDRVQINVREELARLIPELQLASAQAELGAKLSVAPNPAIGQGYQSLGQDAFQSGYTDAQIHSQQAGNPATFLAGLMPFINNIGRRTPAPANPTASVYGMVNA